MNICQEHLKICRAECCKQFILQLPKTQNMNHLVRGAHVCFFKICTRDKIKYYKLHGCKYEHGVISFDLTLFDIVGRELIVYNKCEGLTEDLQCKYHGTDKQPIICHTPNENEHEEGKDYRLTPNCKYKVKK